MTEQMYEDHDTKPIKLPRLGRDSLEPVVKPPEWSPESAAMNTNRMREFDLLDADNPNGLRNFETLRIDDVLNIPVAVRDANNEPIPDAFTMKEYRVVGTSFVDGKLMAKVVDSGGVEDMIAADVFNGSREKQGRSASLEAAIARQLLELDGIDIHSPDARLIEQTDEPATDDIEEREEAIR